MNKVTTFLIFILLFVIGYVIKENNSLKQWENESISINVKENLEEWTDYKDIYVIDGVEYVAEVHKIGATDKAEGVYSIEDQINIISECWDKDAAELKEETPIIVTKANFICMTTTGIMFESTTDIAIHERPIPNF